MPSQHGVESGAENGPPGNGNLYIGCSGWAYPTWKPEFYPAKTSSKNLLPYYASQLNSVEVNYTFRQLPRPSAIQGWLAAVEPFEFRFSFKAPQTITHHKRLTDCLGMLERFYDALSPVAASGRMGVVLYQLPPNLKADIPRLAGFLHEASAAGRRLAFEFRHVSWFTEETFDVLRRHNAALCVAASDGLETPDMVTADFACYRLRKTDYTPDELLQVAAGLRSRVAQGDVFAYFKHEDAPFGPIRAREVLARLREGQ
jgi:uncharacterized protein YecE (DUF72 family)